MNTEIKEMLYQYTYTYKYKYLYTIYIVKVYDNKTIHVQHI